MPYIHERNAVAAEYQRASEAGWVIPAIGVENLTTIEAALTATLEHGRRYGIRNLPVILAITNLYDHRAQSVHYTHTRQWEIGLRLFMADVHALCATGSPFEDLSVMVHLDHTQHDDDHELLGWDMSQFSSIMYDASTLPFEQNIQKTAAFVEKEGDLIYIEGACDEITESGGKDKVALTTPEEAEQYHRATGCDIIVPNLGTEHRASTDKLRYDDALARRIRERIGPCLCLHGASSITPDQLPRLANDGVVKVNFWTALERDSSPDLLESMTRHAGKVAGNKNAQHLLEEGLLGPAAGVDDQAAITHCTTAYRQHIVFESMQATVRRLLEVFIPPDKMNAGT